MIMTNSENNIKQLLQEICSDDDSVRRNSAHELGSVMDERGIYPLIKSLKDISLGVQQTAMDSLIKIGSEAVVYNLLPLLRDEKISIRNMAVEILNKIGSSGIDLLIDLLRDKDENIRKIGADILGKIGDKKGIKPLMKSINDPDTNVRSAIANSLGLLKADAAVDLLISIINDNEWVRFYIIGALGNIGDKKAIPILVKILQMDDGPLKNAAMDALGKIGSLDTIDDIVLLFESSDMEFRNQIIKTMSFISKDDPKMLLRIKNRDKFLNFLIEALEDYDREIRISAVRCLNVIRKKSAIVHLYKALDFVEEQDEEMIQMITSVIESTSDEECLINGLQDKEIGQRSRLTIIRLLGKMRSEEAVLILISLMRNTGIDREEKRAIISTLKNIGDKRALDVITEALEDENGHIRAEAAMAIGKIGEENAVFPLLNFIDKEPYKDVMEKGISELVKIGTEDVINGMIRFLSNKRADVREIVARGLGHFKNPKVISPLLSLLNDVDWRVRKSAIEALSDSLDDYIIDQILVSLNDESEQVRLAAVQCLCKVGKNNTRIIDSLTMCIDDSFFWVRYRAIESLGKIKDNRALLPIIRSIEKDDIPLKVISIWAIGEIGDKDSETILRSLTLDENKEISKAATDALEKIMKNGK